MSTETFTPEERTRAENRLNMANPEIAAAILDTEKRFAADPVKWLEEERAKCARIEIELRAGSLISDLLTVR